MGRYTTTQFTVIISTPVNPLKFLAEFQNMMWGKNPLQNGRLGIGVRSILAAVDSRQVLGVSRCILVQHLEVVELSIS